MNCPAVCEECPRIVNRPLSYEGTQVWDLVLRLGHQLRVSDGRIVGFDFVAAFTLAAAMGVPAPVVAEWLPGIEAAVVREMSRLQQER